MMMGTLQDAVGGSSYVLCNKFAFTYEATTYVIFSVTFFRISLCLKHILYFFRLHFNLFKHLQHENSKIYPSCVLRTGFLTGLLGKMYFFCIGIWTEHVGQ